VDRSLSPVKEFKEDPRHDGPIKVFRQRPSHAVNEPISRDRSTSTRSLFKIQPTLMAKSKQQSESSAGSTKHCFLRPVPVLSKPTRQDSGSSDKKSTPRLQNKVMPQRRPLQESLKPTQAQTESSLERHKLTAAKYHRVGSNAANETLKLLWF